MRQWKLKSADSNLAGIFSSELKISTATARLLVSRGVSSVEQAKAFLNPGIEQLHAPWMMLGMREAVERISQALESQEKILIYGDYDVDGATSVVLLSKALRMLGGSPEYYIPQRLGEGYGLRTAVLEQAASGGVGLVITVDTGIRAHEELRAARQLGLDVIVTDHHLPGSDPAPAVAVLNPHQEGCQYPDKNLCGVGVVLKLAQALFEYAGRLLAGEYPKWFQSFFKLAALGTVADSVPLQGENRVLTRLGLEGLATPVNPGLRALLARALPGKSNLRSEDISFRIAPRLNAAGRMRDARSVVELFEAAAPEAGALAEQLEQLNAERQRVEERIRNEIFDRIENEPALSDCRVLCVEGAGWHRGVLGIVASKVMERIHRPVLVFSNEGQLCYGSGRAPAGVHLLRLLETCPELMERFGGHAQAVGVTIATERLGLLRTRLNQAALAYPPATPPVIEIDTELELAEITPRLLRELESCEPFGIGNPKPLFICRNVELISPPEILKERHLKLRLRKDASRFEALGWGMAERAGEVRSRLDVTFWLEQTNHPVYGERIQLILKDWREAERVPAAEAVAAQ